MSPFKKDPICVLKFGSSVLRSEADLPAVVHEIYAELRRGRRVLVVVSAFGSTTDQLLALANSQTPKPEPRVLAQLLATGESTSAALLTLALTRAGVRARSITPSSIGLVAQGDYLDAHPVDLETESIETEFEHAPVLVLPGFISSRADGELALLGRGGSDLSAIFVAGRLKELAPDTRCVLIKDVDGLFEWDPVNTTSNPPRRYARISYDDALVVTCDIVQHKAIRLARELGLSFEVGSASSLSSELGATRVGIEASILKPHDPQRFTRLRIGIIGHGTVGGGVLEHLFNAPEDFEVTGLLVRDLEKHRCVFDGKPGRAAQRFGELFTDDPESFFARPLDVVVEVAGGVDAPLTWLWKSLELGLSVVTANKALLAKHGGNLLKLADTKNCRLSFSAAVGGAAPLLERARQLAPTSVCGFEAVLNGTSNFVAEAISDGASLAEAIAQAQALGYAEADPCLDLNGTDAAQKVEVLARELFGEEVVLHWGNQIGIEDAPSSLFEKARAAGDVVRVVASCTLEDRVAPVSARVQIAPVALSPAHPLAQVEGAGSGAVFNMGDESQACITVIGEGAGRWPTSEAVFADLLDLRRSRSRAAAPSSPASR